MEGPLKWIRIMWEPGTYSLDFECDNFVLDD